MQPEFTPTPTPTPTPPENTPPEPPAPYPQPVQPPQTPQAYPQPVQPLQTPPAYPQPPAPQPPKKSNKVLIWSLIGGGVLTLALIGLGIFMVVSALSKDTTSRTTSPETSKETPKTEEDIPYTELGAIASGQEPSYLRWQTPSLDTNWTLINEETGVRQYRYRDSTCVLRLENTEGMKQSSFKTSEEYAQYVSNSIANAVDKGAPVTTVNTDSRRFTLQVSDSMTNSVTFAGIRARVSSVDSTIQTYAYLHGDVAVYVVVACGGSNFTTYYTTDIEPELSKLLATVRY